MTDAERIEAIWERMTGNERYGVRFGLFPSWIEEYNPTKEDHVALMERAETVAT